MKNKIKSSIDLSDYEINISEEEKARALAEISKEDLDKDPLFVADFLKSRFVENIYQAMESKGYKKSDLAEKIGKSRQYVTRVLNENANFTIETMAEFACVLDMKLEINFIEKKVLVETAVYDETNYMKKIIKFPDNTRGNNHLKKSGVSADKTEFNISA